MTREENKKWIIQEVERLARESGHGNVRFHSWELCDYVDPSELDPNKYTGPAGEVWKLILQEETGREPIASIGLTEKEIDGCKTDQSEAVSIRLHDAVGKLGSMLF
jgi:hypothetical protein